jgi:hypothetical protein
MFHLHHNLQQESGDISCVKPTCGLMLESAWYKAQDSNTLLYS